MKVLICGGRDFSNIEHFLRQLERFEEKYGTITHVVSGAARGADSLGEEWAIVNGRELSSHPAIWLDPISKRLDRGAGPKRNALMLELHPDIQYVLAFAGGAGTADMKRRARAKNIDVLQF